ncbi:MAG: hypothetical protein WAV38_37410 [Xanthobacteraceae bacterium]
MAKQGAPSAELLTEALRAELAELKLAGCEQLRKEDAGYIRELRDANMRLHAELEFFNRRLLKKV